MHVYQMRSSVPSIVSATQERMQVCMTALKDVSKVWLVAKMVHTLFESILGNKTLEDKLQKAAGKRHNKSKHHSHRKEEAQKRKYDDMELPFTNGPPAPQVSYERSRPQTPAATPSRDLGQAPNPAAMGAPAGSATSPNLRQQQTDTFMGGINSRSNTRPPTPFNPSFSIPATPPDLYLVTRNSPPISQNIWENFQPDQLFPESSGTLSLSQFSPPAQGLDPTLSQTMPQMGGQTPNLQASQIPVQGQTTQLPQRGARPPGPASPMPGMSGPGPGPTMGSMMWPNSFESMDLSASSPEDTWSNSSKGQPVPTTLNVEDW